MKHQATSVVAALAIAAALAGTRPAVGGGCAADMNGDEMVDIDDLVAVVLAWGSCPQPCPPCSGDVDLDCVVDADDLIAVILSWGSCTIVEGACCLPENGCEAESEIDCAVLGGTYLGDGTGCGTQICPTTVPANSFDVVTGELLAGTTASLDASDNDHVRVRAVPQGGGHRTELRSTYGGPAPPFGTGTISRLDLAVEISVNQPGVEATVSLRNFATDSWDPIADFPITTDDDWHVRSDIAHPNDYRNEFGKIKVRIVTVGDGAYVARTDVVRVTLSAVLGACCLPEGGCMLVAASDCAAVGGAYSGDGAECDGVECLPFNGACCLPDGGCLETGTVMCAAQAGFFAGAGVTCSEVECPLVAELTVLEVPVGERLEGNRQSLRISDNDRLIVRAAPSGEQHVAHVSTTHVVATAGPVDRIDLTVEAGANVDDVTMRVELRNFVTGTWHLLDEIALATIDAIGNWEDIANPARFVSGDGEARVRLITQRTGEQYVSRTDLIEVRIATVRGACCLPGGGCALSPEDGCVEDGGYYAGDDADCAGTTCTAFTGACCLPDGSCTETDFVACSASGGSFGVDGTLCGEMECPVIAELTEHEVVTGERLAGNLESLRTSDNDRLVVRSEPAGGQQMTRLRTAHVTPVPGPVIGLGLTVEGSANADGVTMRLELRDFVASAWDLIDEVQPTTTDAVWSYPEVASPARYVSNEGQVRVRLVTERSGEMYAMRADVVEVSVTMVLGACCLPAGECTQQAQEECSAAGGVYAGDDAECANTTCTAFMGACCMPNGSCVVAGIVGCAEEGGVLAGDGVSCAEVECPLATELTGYEVVTGEALGGTLPSLQASDNDRVLVRSEQAGGQQVTQLRTTHVAASSGPVTDVGLAVEASATAGGVSLRIELRDFVAAAWEPVEEVPLTTNDSSWSFSGLASPARFVNDAGQVTVRLVSDRDGEPYIARTDLVEVIVATVRGACCLPEGGCHLLSDPDCVGVGGSYAGDDALCADTDCPPFVGACCLPDGSCVETGTVECAAQAGLFQGNGVACAEAICPVVADVTGFEVVTGDLLGGTLASLVASDNDRIVIRSVIAGGGQGAQLRTTHAASGPGQVATRVDLRVEASANASGVSMQIYLRNFKFGGWHLVDEVTLTTTDATWAYAELADPARYVSPAGEVKVRLVTACDGEPYVARVDLAEVLAAEQ